MAASLLISILTIALNAPTVIGTRFSILHYSNVLHAQDLPNNLSKNVVTPSSPGYYETSGYLIGNVAVGMIFLESNGTIDPSTEDWTQEEESQVVSEIQVAFDWWRNQNPSASVSFAQTINYRIPTSYEPINRPSADDKLWISEAMKYLGYLGNNYLTQTRNYINGLRNNARTDWAFAMFIVDSSNDADGMFADKQYSAYAQLGGPYVVMTYTNDGWGVENLDRSGAHEIDHMFYATDEYDGTTEYSGYLNVPDVEGSGALMDKNEWWLSTGTKGQIGWRDSDGDGLQDIIDTFPDTVLTPYSSDPTDKSVLTYTGTVREIPYPNNNPQVLASQRRDITINKITRVEIRIDKGPWQDASADDGAFDEAEENFSFTTPPLSIGNHTIEARGTNSVGNIKMTYVRDEVRCEYTFVYDWGSWVIIIACVAVGAVTTIVLILRMRKRPVTTLPPPPT
jgi:hypothetical protein